MSCWLGQTWEKVTDVLSLLCLTPLWTWFYIPRPLACQPSSPFSDTPGSHAYFLFLRKCQHTTMEGHEGGLFWFGMSRGNGLLSPRLVTVFCHLFSPMLSGATSCVASRHSQMCSLIIYEICGRNTVKLVHRPYCQKHCYQLWGRCDMMVSITRQLNVSDINPWMFVPLGASMEENTRHGWHKSFLRLVIQIWNISKSCIILFGHSAWTSHGLSETLQATMDFLRPLLKALWIGAFSLATDFCTRKTQRWFDS